jgi:hypothetical protein
MIFLSKNINQRNASSNERTNKQKKSSIFDVGAKNNISTEQTKRGKMKMFPTIFQKFSF